MDTVALITDVVLDTSLLQPTHYHFGLGIFIISTTQLGSRAQSKPIFRQPKAHWPDKHMPRFFWQAACIYSAHSSATLAPQGLNDHQEKYRLHLKSLSDELLILQNPSAFWMPSSGPVTCRPTFWPVEDARCRPSTRPSMMACPSASILATSIWSSRSCGTGSAADSAPGRAWPHPARDGGSIHGGHRDAASAWPTGFSALQPAAVRFGRRSPAWRSQDPQGAGREAVRYLLLPGARHLVRPTPKSSREKRRWPNCRASCRAISVTAPCRSS